MSVETLPVSPSAAHERASRWSGLRGRSGRTALELTRPIAWTIVGVLVLGSLLLRLRGLHTYFWIDEGISVGIAGHPLAHIPSLLRQDGSPPLYYLLLHVWMAWRGHSVVATHELSLIFALLAVPVAYWAGSTLFERRTGVICAGLTAGLPYLSQYAEETRMYALLTLLAIIAAASFAHAFALRHRRYLPVFSVSLTAALYTHNWSLFLALASVVGVGVCLWRAEPDARRDLLRDAAIAYGAVAVLYAAWLPTLAYQAAHTGAPWALPPVIWSLSGGLYSLVGGRGAAMVVLLAAGSGLVALRRLGPAERRVELSAILLLTLGLGTLLIAWLYAKSTPAWATRYLAVVAGPLLIAAALGFSRAARLGVVGLVLLAGFWILDPGHTGRNFKSNVAPVAAALRGQLGSDPLVLATQPEEIPTLAYYLPQVQRFGTPLGATPDPRVVDWRNALERLRRGSVRGTLSPMLRGVSVGQRVLLVLPTNTVKAPAWLAIIRRDTGQWRTALERSSHFRLVGSSAAGAHGSGVAVQGLLFERTA
jgi:mannosyltransferase